MRISSIFLIGFVLAPKGNCSLFDKWNPQEAVELIKKDKDVSIKTIGNEESSEYPGNDYMVSQQISEKWEKYYSCLREKYEKANEQKTIIMQIVEGQYASLKCPSCPRPFEEYGHLEWKYKPLSTDYNDPEEPQILDLAQHMKLSRKKSLKIYNAISGYSGLYVCYQGKYPLSIYILEVVRNDNITLLTEMPAANETIPVSGEKGLEVYYLWSKWTQCSVCDTIGKKYRYGICMVKMQDRETNAQSQNGPDIGYNEKNSKKKSRIWRRHYRSRHNRKSAETPRPLINETIVAQEIVDKFRNGIPCTSSLMPNPFSLLVQKLNKSSAVVLIDYCEVQCENSKIFEVVDRDGRILEMANNSAGIYSSYQKIPSMLPKAERKTITAEFGKNIVLQCPGNLKVNIPVRWKIDKSLLIPELVANESSGRMSIDFVNKLHINHLRLKDSRIYSCWQRDKLAGSVTLDVQKKLKLTFDHHVILFSMFLVAVTFIYVGVKVLSREMKMRKK